LTSTCARLFPGILTATKSQPARNTEWQKSNVEPQKFMTDFEILYSIFFGSKSFKNIAMKPVLSFIGCDQSPVESRNHKSCISAGGCSFAAKGRTCEGILAAVPCPV